MYLNVWSWLLREHFIYENIHDQYITYKIYVMHSSISK